MWAKIIFFAAVAGATLVVILLVLVSPSPHNNPMNNQSLSISLYVQPSPPPTNPHTQEATLHSTMAYIFHHKLTAGPKNTSHVIGKAKDFVLPSKHSELAAFNIIYLTFDTPEYCGSLSIEASKMTRLGTNDEFLVVGGTKSFAFARGFAIFAQSDGQLPSADARYYIKLRLKLPPRRYPMKPG